tara:strand:+ start:94 stop:1068 length:975 start_codon:yes stop_codon:yes gene_type:complete
MDLKSLKNIVQSELDLLESRLKVRSKTSVSLINKLGEHIIQSGGKRLRPLVVILASKLKTNSPSDQVIDAAVIIEFIHAATLLHDDVVDMSVMRHSQDTANTIWGNKGAVLVGDFLYSRAFEIIVEINDERIYETLAHTTNTIAQGEVMQLMNIENTKLSEKEYMEIIYRKTAILFEASAKIGGIVSDYNDHEIDSLSKYGYHFGIAYQLRNDYLDYFGSRSLTGKNLAEDLSEGKVTLPIIHALGKCSESNRAVIEKAIVDYNSGNQSELIINILKSCESDTYLQAKIDEQTDLALSYAKCFSENEYRDTLITLAEFCRCRES